MQDYECKDNDPILHSTTGRMHSDAQFAGSSSVPAHVEMMGFLGVGNNPMVGATIAIAVAIRWAMCHDHALPQEVPSLHQTKILRPEWGYVWYLLFEKFCVEEMSVSLVLGDNVRFVDNLIVGRCEYGEKVVSLFETFNPKLLCRYYLSWR